MTLRSILEDQKVVVCVGSGGVGKTTTAAALALEGAKLGKRALVITIDPARRLANALGLEELLLTPSRVPETILRDGGLGSGLHLDAMMLDLQAAWDDMVERNAHSRGYAERILANRFYGYLSRELPGAHDFIACEALFHVSLECDYDLIVLDTPPTANALDFLDAPDRILSFLDHDAVKLFAKSKGGRFGLRFLDGAAGVAQSVLSRVAGESVIEELSEFLVLLKDLYEPLAANIRGFQDLMASHQSRFVIVTSAERGPAREAKAFYRLLCDRVLPVGAVVVNRVAPRVPEIDVELEPTAQAIIDDARFESERDQRVIDGLREDMAGLPLIEVTRRATDVHTVNALIDLLEDLTAPPVGGLQSTS